MNTIGVDGCKAGWVVCWSQDSALCFQVFSSFKSVLQHFPKAVIAVDMPIGLPDNIGAGGRGPEALIRPWLGQRKSSVFSIPSRRAVFAENYAAACQLAFETSNPPRKISKQGFFLFAKVREIDELLQADPTARARVFETHPEMVFRTLKQSPLHYAKKTMDGATERTILLQDYGFACGPWPKIKGAAQDDIIDAAACLVTADRILNGLAVSYPSPPAVDSFGIPLAIWV